MNQKLYISSFCRITNNSITVNGKEVFTDNNNASFGNFSKKAYKFKEIEYPKFFKMDTLCKLSFLATEFLATSVTKFKENTAIVLSNNSSSLDTDRNHQHSIQNKESFYPSPAIFVYTLPNIAIGEISIRHQLKSENAFFVSEKLNEELLFNYTNILIANKKSNNVICGWVNFDQDNYEAFVYLVSNTGKNLHTKQIIKELYLDE